MGLSAVRSRAPEPKLKARPAHPWQRSTTLQCRIWAAPTFDIAFSHHVAAESGYVGGSILGRSRVLALSLQGRTHCFPPLNSRPAHRWQRSTTQQCRIRAPPTFDIAVGHHAPRIVHFIQTRLSMTPLAPRMRHHGRDWSAGHRPRWPWSPVRRSQLLRWLSERSERLLRRQ